MGKEQETPTAILFQEKGFLARLSQTTHLTHCVTLVTNADTTFCSWRSMRPRHDASRFGPRHSFPVDDKETNSREHLCSCTTRHYDMPIKKRTVVLVLLPVLSAYAVMIFLRGLPATCPSPDMLQSDFVKSSFDISRMEGTWYELAMKDITQPRICSCQTSNKTVHQKTLHDEFRLECFGNSYSANISFAIQDTPGVVMGTWNVPLLNRILFPNTVVDVQVGTDGTYEWIIEFQCIQGTPLFGWNWIGFYAFNFYSRTTNDGEQRLKVMEARARQRGIGPFIDHGAKLAIINHSNCLYAQ